MKETLKWGVDPRSPCYGCQPEPAPTLCWDLLLGQGCLPDRRKLPKQPAVNPLWASFHIRGPAPASSPPHPFAPSHLLSTCSALTCCSHWRRKPSEGLPSGLAFLF